MLWKRFFNVQRRQHHLALPASQSAVAKKRRPVRGPCLIPAQFEMSVKYRDFAYPARRFVQLDAERCRKAQLN
jgi:hypothetical protein